MRERGGFTLVEALVALTLSAILVLLVSTTFLVQNNFYANVLQRARIQDNARSVTDVVSADLRSLMDNAITQADSATLVARVPLQLMMVCKSLAHHVIVNVPGGVTGLDTDKVSGVGVRASDGTWTYYDVAWSSIYAPRDDDAKQCYNDGADTTGATAEFMRLAMDPAGVTPPTEGSAMMLYSTTEYAFAQSALDSATTALYEGVQGDTLVELATGMASDAHFEYKKGSGSWASSVSSGLDAIDRVRIHAHALATAEASSQRDLDFDLVNAVPLRNVP